MLGIGQKLLCCNKMTQRCLMSSLSLILMSSLSLMMCHFSLFLMSLSLFLSLHPLPHSFILQFFCGTSHHIASSTFSKRSKVVDCNAQVMDIASEKFFICSMKSEQKQRLRGWGRRCDLEAFFCNMDEIRQNLSTSLEWEKGTSEREKSGTSWEKVMTSEWEKVMTSSTFASSCCNTIVFAQSPTWLKWRMKAITFGANSS